MDTVSKLSREEIFAETIKGLQSMTDDTAKAALANDLFGRSGQEILPLLNQTAESTDALMKKAQDYGFIMSDKAVTASAEFTDSLDLLSHTSTGLKNKFIGEFLPSVTKITDGLALFVHGRYQRTGSDQRRHTRFYRQSFSINAGSGACWWRDRRSAGHVDP